MKTVYESLKFECLGREYKEGPYWAVYDLENDGELIGQLQRSPISKQWMYFPCIDNVAWTFKMVDDLRDFMNQLGGK